MASEEHTDEAKWTAAWVALGGMFGPAGLVIAGLSAIIGNALLKEEADDVVETEAERRERIMAWLEADDARWRDFEERAARWRATHEGERPKPPTKEDNWRERWRRAAYRAQRAKWWAEEAWDRSLNAWDRFAAWWWRNFDRGVDAAEEARENGQAWWWWQPNPNPHYGQDHWDQDMEWGEGARDDNTQDAEFWEDEPGRKPDPERKPEVGAGPPPGGGQRKPDPAPGGAGGGTGPDRRPRPDPSPETAPGGQRRPHAEPLPPPDPRPVGGQPQMRPPIAVPSSITSPKDEPKGNDMTTLVPSGSGRGTALAPRSSAGAPTATAPRTSRSMLAERKNNAMTAAVTGAEIQALALEVFARKHGELMQLIVTAAELAKTLSEGAVATMSAALGNSATTETNAHNEALAKLYDLIDGDLTSASEYGGVAVTTIHAAIGTSLWERAMQEAIDASGADGEYFSRRRRPAGA